MIYLIMETGGMETAWPIAYRNTRAAAEDYCKIMKQRNPEETYLVLELSEDA